MIHLGRVVIALLMIVSVRGETRAREPFVSGFDRFGRHQEIDAVVAGKLLISELSCTACHKSENDSLSAKGGPHLDDAGNRLNPDWTILFLASPSTVKPGTTMPDVLAGKPDEEREQIAKELTAFLLSQTKPLTPVKASGANPVPFEFWKKGDTENGKRLYHRVGCVACHEPDASVRTVPSSDSQLDRLLDELDPEELAEMGLSGAARQVRSVPQADLATKYSREALTHFLLDPLESRPAGRMPNLKLSATEAADISAYLQGKDSKSSEGPRAADDTLIERGRRAFASLGCAACHQASRTKSTLRAKAFDDLDVHHTGCLDGTKNNYLLDPLQADTIRAAWAATQHNDQQDDSEKLLLTMLQLNCFACHQRDELGGVGRFRKDYFHTVDEIDLGDEGRLPPPLTHVGMKLTNAHFKNVLLGKNADIRPHMHIRMPVFAARSVESLPSLLAKIDGKHASSFDPKMLSSDKGTEDIGRELMDVGCIQCHAFRGHALPGVVGVDLMGIDARVHPGWFQDFLLNPGSLKDRTRMPTFFPDGKSQHPQLLDGDPHRQIGAMWSYLKDIQQQPLPEKIEQARSQNYELVPAQQPMVLRTFIEGVGPRTIAVGFAQQVHYVFDTQHGRLALGWRGRFLDAQGTWFIRFAPPAAPLGENVITMPTQLFDSSVGTYRFQGYRLDAERVPTFLYEVGDLHVTDKIVPDATNGLLRTINVQHRKPSDSPQTVWLRVLDGTSIKQQSSDSYTNDRGLTVAIVNPPMSSAAPQDKDGKMLWSVPLTVNNNTSVQVKYAW